MILSISSVGIAVLPMIRTLSMVNRGPRITLNLMMSCPGVVSSSV